MTAKTATFLELQRIYRERAERDIAALEGHLARLEQEKVNGRSKIAASYVRLYAKNARHLRSAACPSPEKAGEVKTELQDLHGCLGSKQSRSSPGTFLSPAHKMEADRISSLSPHILILMCIAVECFAMRA